ncbi:hypothetical protein [Streptomyces sp. NPDC058475]|uniref:hypothetical protein n=1 Tax=Streptomyces sp. NPDC058475 TaxID=3346518 RepID=UPI00365888CE
MKRQDIPDTASASGLSTDDLAQPRDRTTENAAGPPSEAPTFPGESTRTASESTEPEDRDEDSDTTSGAGLSDVRTEDTQSEDTQSEDAQTTDAQTKDARTEDADAGDETPQLLSTEDEEGFRARWQEVQNQFVDDPRDAVHTADALVADVMQRLAATFADHKQELEGQWNRGEQANTEDLRLALRHYRSFFNRLLVT